MPRLRRYGFCAALFLTFILHDVYYYTLRIASRGSIPAESKYDATLYEEDENGVPAQELSYHEKPAEAHKGDFISWEKVPLRYPIHSPVALPKVKPRPLPRIQHQFREHDAETKGKQADRQAQVKEQFLRSWNSYRERAWMHDELKPVQGNYQDPFGGWAATLIDSLDTLWIMGLHDEFEAATSHVEKIDFGSTTLDKVNVFETNIRQLGGLLAAYELSEERRLLAKAKEVGEMIFQAFDTPNHMPTTRWVMSDKVAGVDQIADANLLLAELGSFTLEFTRLSQATGDPKFYDAANRITRLLADQQMKTRLRGMWPKMVNARAMDLTQGSTFTLGSMADSTYEYFAKAYALLGGTDPIFEQLYTNAMETAINYTLYRPMNPENLDLLATGHIDVDGAGDTSLIPELQHLACYAGGMFALGGKLFKIPAHVDIGRKLTDTCIWAYSATPSGIMPEVSKLYPCPPPLDSPCTWDKQLWREKVDALASAQNRKPLSRLPIGFTEMRDRRYLLRPEAIESVFVLYRITGDAKYQDAAWDMWTAITAATQTRLANSAIWDVLNVPPTKDSGVDTDEDEKKRMQDSMESFWMAETLKYFYLVFAEPGVLSLDDWVFNTEAHPLRIPRTV
ncbi:unnamed protein product [Periconia digitata]|uniref:alpha-1,2-Mannosidase n=1 Tax=Periconia digitata TaxID=1303443 RepID=A0A9W4UMV6_9PLEO|nr:unnamed protein product [Periconia digitata]